MNNLYNKIYNAVNEGIQKALLIDPEQNDVSINYLYSKINSRMDPLLLEFMDLGLPSGTLWCTHNIGATCGNTVESWYGNYYAWGEIESKSNYIWSTYSEKFCNQAEYQHEIKLIKYNTKKELKYGKYKRPDNLQFLLPGDDIVQVEYSKIRNSKIAKNVKMPTKAQAEELITHTKIEWVTNYNNINGLNGQLLIGPNNNYIFIPAAGCYRNSNINEYAGIDCYMWTNSLNIEKPVKAWGYGANDMRIAVCERCYGLTVRGVY